MKILREDTTQIVNCKNTVFLNSFAIKGDLNASNATCKTPTSISLIDHLLINREISLVYKLQIEENLLSDHNRQLISMAQNTKSHKPKTNEKLYL
ncbi:hypothetical protein HHI36_014410 [Cryptolaemus montrouzieri]|uniref:Uncharacterized protein n=1 Tax=Cryptolaemus montrouzieri TaxID=559131 RepID=A0ABD2N2M0_9CUCU